jgi:3-isopropylmalate/(R)-2-methylmalate dehydratase small subunit
MSEPFTLHTGIAAVLALDGVEADQIIPARLCVRPAGADYGDALFAPWRYREDGSESPEFVLNREPFRRASILVTGANFGYGSSREHAAWAVRDFGIRAIVASSFASIFAANAARNGILPVALASDELDAIRAELAHATLELTIDLTGQEVRTPAGSCFHFEIAPLDRELLLAGIDAIDLVLRHEDEVAAFERADRARRPWAYETGSRV